MSLNSIRPGRILTPLPTHPLKPKPCAPRIKPHPKPPNPHPSTTRRFKVNLLPPLPLVRSFLRGDFFPERLNHGFTKYAFAVVSTGMSVNECEWEGVAY